MNSAEVEAKLKTLTETVAKLETKIKEKEQTEEQLKARLQTVEDTESIKKLQHAYCYYLEHWQEEEIISLWSHSPEVSVELNETGLYKGWEAVKKISTFPSITPATTARKRTPGISAPDHAAGRYC